MRLAQGQERDNPDRHAADGVEAEVETAFPIHAPHVTTLRENIRPMDALGLAVVITAAVVAVILAAVFALGERQ